MPCSSVNVADRADDTMLAPTVVQRPAPGQVALASELNGLRKRFFDDAMRASAPLIDTIISEPRGPDIQWHPSFATYQKRVEQLSALIHDRPGEVPEGYPVAVNSARAWTGGDFTGERDYVVKLNEADVLEVERALSYSKCKARNTSEGHILTGPAIDPNFGPDDVCKETFPLPALRPRLEAIARELHGGRGFAVLRGLEPRRYTARDNLLIYLGLTAYIAEHRAVQDSGGSMISMSDRSGEASNS